MEERKLNFNAPLLSVRRFSGTSSFQDRNKKKKAENPPPTARFALPWYCSDVSSDQVTEPVAVPFVWEQIPGKAKGGVELEFVPDTEASGTPRLPPGQISKVVKRPVEEKCVNQDVVRPQTETYALNDNVSKLDCLNEGVNEKCISGLDNDDDVYSDALDTLTDAFSVNCSMSGLSGSDGQVAKPSGTCSMDPQTQDFMLQRFLPAAMAMTLETPKYASKNRSVAPEQPREVKRAVIEDRKPPANRYESAIIPYYNQDVEEEEETEDEYDYYRDSGNLTRTACGLLPRLCFKSSLGHLYPVPGLKVRSHSSMSSTHEIVKPQKATYSKSRCQTVEKNVWDVGHKNKSDRGVQSTGIPENKLDSAVQSPRLSKDKPDTEVQSPGIGVNRSESPLKSPRISKDKPDRGVQSPRLLVSKSDGAFQPPRLSKDDKSDTEVQPPRLPEIRKELICVSTQFSSPNDQQMMNRSPPKRLPSSGRISPYRRERPQSPFRGGGFLGLPKEAEKYKANMMVKYTRSNSNTQELVPYLSTGQGSGSPSPAVEKTLCVDTVNSAETSSSNSLDTKVQMEYIGANRVLEESATVESLEYEILGSAKSSESSFSVKPDTMQKGRLDPVLKSLQHIKVRAGGNLSHRDDDDSKVADEASAGSDYSPLPPPLPKTPSESWLWRALPSKKQFLQSYDCTRFKPKKHEHKPPATDAKWEAIVKTSYLHHDHARYSEELVTPFSQQSKT